MESRQPGWAAAANPAKAESAFTRWQQTSRSADVMSIRDLTLARDYAVLTGKRRQIVELINRDLRQAVGDVVNEQAAQEQHDADTARLKDYE